MIDSARWPALRTKPVARPPLQRLAAAALAAWIAPPAAGAALLVLGNLLPPGPGPTALSVEGFFLMSSVRLSWAGLLAGVPLSVLALRAGLAGWAVALGAGAALGVGAGLAVGLEPGIVLPGSVMAAAAYWLTLRGAIGPDRMRPEDR